MNNMEGWSTLDGFSRYEISQTGKIRNKTSGRPISPTLHRNGTLITKLYSDQNVRVAWRLNRLIATFFIPNPEGCKYVIHKNSDPKDNRVENLEWTHNTSKYREKKTQTGRSVIQIDAESGEIIKEWKSIHIAAATLGIHRNAICSVCRGVYGYKRAGSFKWKYADTEELSGEIWKTTRGVKVSNTGRIHLASGKITDGSNDSSGYKVVKLSGKAFRVHTLVAEAFLEKQEKDTQVNHINGDTTDNNVGNLEWCTASENAQHAFDTKLTPKPTGQSRAILVYIGDRLYKEFSSITETRRSLNVGKNTVIRHCRGKVKNPRGKYTFAYKD